MIDKIKLKVSSFVAQILENDALQYGFLKNEKPNKNALINKLIPILLEIRKDRREMIGYLLEQEYQHEDSEKFTVPSTR